MLLFILQQASGLALNRVDPSGHGLLTTQKSAIPTGPVLHAVLVEQIVVHMQLELRVQIIRGVLALAVLYTTMFVRHRC